MIIIREEVSEKKEEKESGKEKSAEMSDYVITCCSTADMSREYMENNKEQANVANLYKQEIRDSYAQKIPEEVINPIVESIVEQNIVIENMSSASKRSS